MCYLILRPITSQQYSSKVKYQAKFYSTTVGNGGGGGGGGHWREVCKEGGRAMSVGLSLLTAS